jgi:hypothetical protein
MLMMCPSHGLNEKGRSGGVPVQPFGLTLYLKNTKLDTVNVPTFLIFISAPINSLARFPPLHLLTRILLVDFLVKIVSSDLTAIS